MTTEKGKPITISETTRIEEIKECLIEPTIVLAGDDIVTVCDKITRTPRSRNISVVDDKGVLIGIIPARRFFDTIFLRVMPVEALANVPGIEAAIELAREAAVRTARDAMTELRSVTMQDTLHDAFQKMHRHRLSGLPVIDEAGKVISYLDQLQVLSVWVMSQGR